MTRKALIAAAILSLPAGCAMPFQRPPAAPSMAVETQETWRDTAAEPDIDALDALPRLWAVALAETRRAGYGRRVAGEEALLDPAAGLPRAAPAPGAYLCRVLRIGAPGPGARPWSESGQGFCFVGADRDRLSLTVEAGPRRMGGYLWEEPDNRRLVFLGAQSPRGMPLAGYGDDRLRDVAGIVERIGPFRYRLTLPARAAGAMLTVVELRAAPEQ